jgi:hypothetical protein
VRAFRAAVTTSRGVGRRNKLACVLAVALASAGLAAGATQPAGADTPSSQGYAFVGAGVTQTYVVPEGVTAVEVELFGAAGGAGGTCPGDNCGVGGQGGRGAEVVTFLQVAPGQTLTIVVGGQGAAGPDNAEGGGGGAGGGGSATSLAVSGSAAAIAGGGGGGGGGGYDHTIDFGPNTAGGRGGDSCAGGHTSSHACSGYGGSAGPSQAGGAGGGDLIACSAYPGNAGVSGALGAGGTGGAGGQGGDGALGGGGGGGGGVSADQSTRIAGAGGGGAGGTSALFGHSGVVFEGVRGGNGQALVVPLPALPPGGSPMPGPPAPGAGDMTVPNAVAVSPRFTG